MDLDKYKVTDENTIPLVRIFGSRAEQWEGTTPVVEFKHVPLEEVNGESLLHILKTPGVDLVEISLE